jgi:hypothetical protein
MTRPPDAEGRRLAEAAPSTTPTAATTPEIAATIPDRGDAEAADAAEAAEAAEQLAFDWHLADDREYPPGLEHCACSCPWCAERWTA